MNKDLQKVAETESSTKTWCNTVHTSLTDVEKAILFHEHEAKCNRFFGKYDQAEYHTYMVGAIQRMAKYSEYTKENYAQALRQGL